MIRIRSTTATMPMTGRTRPIAAASPGRPWRRARTSGTRSAAEARKGRSSHHRWPARRRYPSREATKAGKAAGSDSHSTPANQRWRLCSRAGSNSVTTWWPSGVSRGLRGSTGALAGSKRCPCSTRTRSTPRPVWRCNSRARARSAPNPPITWPAQATSQARRASWLPTR